MQKTNKQANDNSNTIFSQIVLKTVENRDFFKKIYSARDCLSYLSQSMQSCVFKQDFLAALIASKYPVT